MINKHLPKKQTKPQQEKLHRKAKKQKKTINLAFSRRKQKTNKSQINKKNIETMQINAEIYKQ